MDVAALPEYAFVMGFCFKISRPGKTKKNSCKNIFKEQCLTPLLDCEHAEVVVLLLLLRARTSSVTLIVGVESEIL